MNIMIKYGENVSLILPVVLIVLESIDFEKVAFRF